MSNIQLKNGEINTAVQKINNVVFSEKADEDFNYWENHNKKIFDKINNLIDDILDHPFIGLGKPEALKHQHTGKWSRRITKEHRLVYKVVDKELIILQCRYHY